tara:strand:- start:26394 stop:27824 length:1431 start_codon:yes stop_codon:yes gene_type:complete
MDQAPAHIVVMGAGLAGLVAANRAAELGARVTLIERGEGAKYRANSRFTGGVFHVAFEDINAGAAKLEAAIARASNGYSDPELVHAYARDAGRVVSWLADNGADFGQGGAAPWMSRMLMPFSLREPGFANHWPDKGADRLLDVLAGRLAQRGGTFLRGHRGQSLVMHKGACVGLSALDTDGQKVTFQATAVIIADGGFQGNADLVRRFISPQPDKLCMRGAGTGMGDGLMMAEAVGAKLVGLESFYGHVQASEALENDALWPYPILDILASSALIVGPDGRRFTDEGLGGVPLANAIARLDDPLSSFVIFDGAIWEGPGRSFLLPPNPTFEERGVQIFRADTLEQLAGQIGVLPDALKETVDQYNIGLAQGQMHTLSPPRTVRAETLAGSPNRVSGGPYMAIRLCAGLTYTMGGISIDADARVLSEGGAPIPGLFAAGSATGGLDGGPDAVYLGGLARAATFGLRAGESAAGNFGH